jgi:hypothetical protein
MSFAVFTDNDGTDSPPTGATPWATIATGATKSWMLTLDTTQDFTLLGNDATADITLYIKKTLDNWGSYSDY